MSSNAYLRGELAPDIITGPDGVNYDGQLEHLYTVLGRNDLSQKEIILNNLFVYAAAIATAKPEPDMTILDDTEAAMKWVTTISGVHVFSLNEEQRAAALENHKQEHLYGAFIQPPYEGFQYKWITAHSVRNVVLLAVVQRFREISAPHINPEVPKHTLLQ